MKTMNIADLFCGAGGSSTGAIEAASIMGYLPKLTVVNHWDRAIETHKANHPHARHFCTGVDNINPRDLFGENELDVLVASPECTHFSTARGGRPVNEQSRATAMCVIRWAETLRPPVFMIENVPEFRSWGPVVRKRVKGEICLVPDPKRKGELFKAWLEMLRAIGYKVDHTIVCCANMGDPTTRKRLFIQGQLGKRKIFWPNPTHVETPGSELFAGTTKQWATARNDVIDWSLEGKSIYERKKPLSPKTMARIWAGLQKFGLKPFIVPQHNEQGPRSVDRPSAAVTTTSRGVKLVQPQAYLVNMKGKSKGADIDRPAPAVTAHAPHLMLAEPFITANFGERKGQQPRVHSVNDPAPAVTSRGAGNLIQPCLIKLRGGDKSHIKSCSKSVDAPVPALTTANNVGLAQPFLVQVNRGNTKKEKDGNKRRVKSVDEPMGAVCGESPEWAVIQTDSFLVQLSHADGKGPNAARQRTRSVDEPHPTVCGHRGDFAVCEPSLLPQQSGGVLRSVEQPAPTIATDGAVALVEPYLVKFYGTGAPASVDGPLDTVRTKDSFGLVRPVLEIEGQHYVLDIRFRMLQPHELAAAQGFRKDYQFTGNKTEIVKMIGNAVPRRTLRALILAAWAQTSDVSALLVEEDAA